MLTAGQHTDLLLTALALLEHQMRAGNVTTAVPVNPSGRALDRLTVHFGPDSPTVIQAVDMRHRLLQDAPVDAEMLSVAATQIADVARRKLNLPPLANAGPDQSSTPG